MERPPNPPNPLRAPRYGYVRFVALLGALALLALTFSQYALAATNTADTIVVTATNLSLNATYSLNAAPNNADERIEFNGPFTGGTTFDVVGTSLTYGTLDDEDATQILTILNNSATAATLTLSNNVNNEATGAASGDLLFVTTGGNLTIKNGAGALTLVLGKQAISITTARWSSARRSASPASRLHSRAPAPPRLAETSPAAPEAVLRSTITVR